jgi:N,N'-diacetyllegionaminate synthase
VKLVDIAGRRIGPGEPTYVIAEAGSNHDGNLDQAYALIDLAVEARADAVKFQTFRAEALYPRSAGQTDYLALPRSIFDVIREMEMPREWIPKLAARCRERGIDFLSTPFDEHSADLLEEHVALFKIASYEMTHVPLVQHIAGKGKPAIMSTGTASLEEVGEAVASFRATGNDQLILMQCTARYPAPLSALNLRTIPLMRSTFDLPVGLSDHSREALTGPIAAVALGASAIEKHFTLSNRLSGPDHVYALEGRELIEMVAAVRAAEKTLGSGIKEPLPEEMELRTFARRSILSTRMIAAGEPLTRENIAVLRCGNLGYGLHPREFPALIGRVARSAIAAEQFIRHEHLA